MNTEKKLTAVEWLVNELKKYDIRFIEAFELEINQAKEKEKQQIIEIVNNALQTDFYVNYESIEQYYEETYKKD